MPGYVLHLVHGEMILRQTVKKKILLTFFLQILAVKF